MRDRWRRFVVDERTALPALVVVALLAMALQVGRAVGLCIVVRLTRRAVPGCVPAWSADRAPPGRSAVACRVVA